MLSFPSLSLHLRGWMHGGGVGSGRQQWWWLGCGVAAKKRRREGEEVRWCSLRQGITIDGRRSATVGGFASVSAKKDRRPLTRGERVNFNQSQTPRAMAADLSFQEPLIIVKYPDPLLRAKNKLIDTFDDNLKKLVEEMFQVMYKSDGIGLSAPQVGINVQLMVFNPVGKRGEGEEIVLVNPEVRKYSKKMVLFHEGCLSFPGIYADVERPESVKIHAKDVFGAKFSYSLSGLPARVFQHEFDHLQGVLFFDRMTEVVVDSIRGEVQALENKYEEKTGKQSPEKISTRRRREAAAGFGK